MCEFTDMVAAHNYTDSFSGEASATDDRAFAIYPIGVCTAATSPRFVLFMTLRCLIVVGAG